MTVEIKAPTFPESVADGVVATWHKQPGEAVARDELLVEIETDKVVMEVVAPEPGVIEAIIVAEGETIASEAVLATLAPGDAPSKSMISLRYPSLIRGLCRRRRLLRTYAF